MHLTAEEGLNIFFYCDQGLVLASKCQFLISKFRQPMYSLAIYSQSIIKIYNLYAPEYSWYTIVVFAKIESKKALFCLCVREEIHSQGRSSRCWEKIHTGFFWMQKNEGFFLFIFMINNSAVKWLISEKMNSKWGAGNPVWNQGGF